MTGSPAFPGDEAFTQRLIRRKKLFLALAIAGVSIAGASGKLDYTETIEFPGGDLVVAFDEGGQKRFDSVGYELTATASAISCEAPDHCIGVLSTPIDTITGLVPDDKGRVTGILTLVPTGGGGTICGCTLHMDYSDVTLTNLTTGHVYRLDPISGDSP